MTIQTHRLTYDDLQEIPPDGRRYELIGGDLIVSPAPSTAHHETSLRFTLWLGPFVTQGRLGRVCTAPYDVKLSEYDVVQPDILFVSPARRHVVGEHCVEGAPDLLVEIISPSSRQDDEGSAVRVLSLNAAGRYEEVPIVDGIARSMVLPGFAADVAAPFAGVVS